LKLKEKKLKDKYTKLTLFKNLSSCKSGERP